MKTILICVAAALAIGAVACGKSAAVSVCEKMNSCAGTTEDCNKSSSSSTSSTSTTSTESKCTSETDAYMSCYDAKGTCENKVYSPGTKCDAEAAALMKCALGG